MNHKQNFLKNDRLGENIYIGTNKKLICKTYEELFIVRKIF